MIWERLEVQYALTSTKAFGSGGLDRITVVHEIWISNAGIDLIGMDNMDIDVLYLPLKILATYIENVD